MIKFFDIGEPHLQYIKGLPGPYCVATSETDQNIRENYPGEAINEKQYHAIVEEMAGRCRCGGKFSFKSRPKCPKCKSVALEDTGEMTIMYD